MPRILPPRKNPVVDMTAMCDVAFLLLTFFILTAKFKPQAVVAVDVPAARSTMHVDDVIVITLNTEGKAFISMKEKTARYAMLEQMVEHYGERYPQLKTLTDPQKNFFALVETWGTPVNTTVQALSLDPSKFKEYQEKEMPGIPYDSLDNQLGDCVMAARYATNGKIKIGIKGDKNAQATYVKQVIKSLTAKEIHRFVLITTLSSDAEGEGEETPAAPAPTN